MYHGKPTRAMGHLLRALRLDPPMDVDYIVYATRRIADSEVCCFSGVERHLWHMLVCHDHTGW